MHNYSVPYLTNNMYSQNNSYMRNYPSNKYNYYPNRNDRLIGPGGFLLPFSLGFISSPLIFGATRPRPPYPYYPRPGYFPYY